MLMVGLQTMIEKFGVRLDFEEIFAALEIYSDVFGLKL